MNTLSETRILQLYSQANERPNLSMWVTSPWGGGRVKDFWT